MDLAFDGRIVEWRGPAPFYFVPVPEEECDALAAMSPEASYGWGVIPVLAHIGTTDFTTSLLPKDGGYLLPVKDAVRRAEQLSSGSHVSVRMSVSPLR